MHVRRVWQDAWHLADAVDLSKLPNFHEEGFRSAASRVAVGALSHRFRP